jgi:methanogenic corrinoid protein MtbC1
MKAGADAIEAAGLRDKARIMIGGGQVDGQMITFRMQTPSRKTL